MLSKSIGRRTGKQGVGQALAYAAAVDLRPGLILLCRKSDSLCLQHSLGAQEAFGAGHVSATIWECLPADESLDACRRVDVGSE